MQELMTEKNIKEFQNCGLIRIYGLLGKKWSMPILHSFMSRDRQKYVDIHRRYRKIINPSLLSDRLKSFQMSGIISKDEENVYSLTRFGRRLVSILHEVKEEAISEDLKIPAVCRTGICACSRLF